MFHNWHRVCLVLRRVRSRERIMAVPGWGSPESVGQSRTKLARQIEIPKRRGSERVYGFMEGWKMRCVRGGSVRPFSDHRVTVARKFAGQPFEKMAARDGRNKRHSRS